MFWWVPLVRVRTDDSPAAEELRSAKAARTKFRRNAVEGLIREHRRDLLSEAFQGHVPSGVCLNNSTTESEVFDNSIFEMLSNTIRLINPLHEGGDVKCSEVLIFSDIDSAVDSILEGADERFGEMAGIDQNQEYRPVEDSFAVNLQK